MKIPQILIEHLVSRVEIELIYQFSYQVLDKDYNRLVIVPHSKSTLTTSKLSPIVGLFLEEIPEFTFQIVHYGELKSDLNMGQLLYTGICTPQNLIYQASKKTMPVRSPTEVNTLVRKSNDHFINSHKKANDFMQGTHFYIEQNNYHQAAFMLHQAAEICLRGISNAIIKRDRPSHCIMDHIKLFSRYIPEIGYMFTRGNVFKYEPIKQLDKAYVNVRYKNNYQIEKKDLLELTEQIQRLLHWSQQFYNDCIAQLEHLKETPNGTKAWSVFDNSLLNKEGIESQVNKVLDEEQRAQLIRELDKICEQHQVLQLNLIGATNLATTNHYFALVILTNGQKEKSKTHIHKEFKLTVLFEPEETVKYALEKKNRFFSQSLSKGEVLYKSSTHDIKFVEHKPDWPHIHKRVISVWRHRIEHAHNFFDSATVLLESNKTPYEPSLILLGHCVEQVCIGFIYTHTGYYVNNCTIPFLLNICDLINPEFAEIINQCSEDERRTRNALFTCISDIRYKTQHPLKLSDICLLIERCSQLLQFAEEQCAIEVERLSKAISPELQTF